MWCWIALAGFIIFIIILYLLSPLISPAPVCLRDSHVIVTGGSSGIGKAIAFQAVKHGAKVTLVARDKKKLEDALNEILSTVKDNDREFAQFKSVDLSQDFDAVAKTFQDAESTFGPVDFLINCAGTSVPGYFEELPVSEFKRMMDINYMSVVHASKVVVPGMKSRGHGRIVFVSSQAGQLGLFGFSAYSASKFALRGLAESLQMELKAYNVHITVAFPPDTNTPGFHEEQKTKPEETKLISEISGLLDAETVADNILSDAVRGRFFCSFGIDGIMLSSLTCGFSPVTSLMEATQQVVTMGLFRVISLFYLDHFDRLIRRCKAKREETNKKSS